MKKVIICGILVLFLGANPVAAEDQALSDEEKLYGLSVVWSEAKYSFADFHLVPDLDWDQTYKKFIPRVLETKTRLDYYRVLQEFIAFLKEGHSYIWFPRDIRENDVKKVPVILREFEGKAVVTQTSQGLVDVLPVGTVILSVNGVPMIEHLEQNVFPLMNMGAPHTHLEFSISGASAMGIGLLIDTGPETVSLTVELPNGVIEKVNVTRVPFYSEVSWISEVDSSILEFKWLERDIAYVALNSFGDEKIVDDFKNILPELYKAKGLIIDVRKNGGGTSDYGYAVTKYLTEERIEASKWETREHIGSFAAWGEFLAEYTAHAERRAMYQGEAYFIEPVEEHEQLIVPTAVLSSHRTFSAAEDFLVSLDLIPHVTVIGEPSGGSTGQPLRFELPGGGGGQVTSKHDYFPDGREFVGFGVQPDIFMSPTVEDFRAGRDLILEKAIEVLEQKISN